MHTGYYIAVIVLASFCAVLLAFSVFVIRKNGYVHKIREHLGLSPQGKGAPMDFAVEGWKNCLMKMDYECDVAFFGDSITRASDFREFFDGVRICNLGFAGDTVEGIKRRVPMLEYVKPKKVFILIGINSLRDNNIDLTYRSYSELLDEVLGAVPGARIYVLSLLPVGAAKERKSFGRGLVRNTTIRAFNERLARLAAEKGTAFVDIYPAYEKDGQMDPAYTTDGLHIYGHYEPFAKVIEPYIYE